MKVIFNTFRCPKDGAAEDQNDDAYAPGKPGDKTTSLFRCAVADGATESLFAYRWAVRVARAFKRGCLSPERRSDGLSALQAEWRKFLKSKQLPWYAEAKAEAGSFTTLLGLELKAQSHPKSGTATWIATALGDSCLFMVRDESLEEAFPIKDPDSFDNRPHLLASNPRLNKRFSEWLVTTGGELRPGDRFYLMTDALSSWFLREEKLGRKPWVRLSNIGTDAAPAFADWIGKLRLEDDRMNDDATLVRVEVESVE